MTGAVLVFGGRGMVGRAVCRELAKRGRAPSQPWAERNVLALGRSAGQGGGGPAPPGVEDRSGVDALQPSTYKQLLGDGASAVVISIGEPPWVLNKERAIRSNGATNVEVLKAAAEAKVPRVVLVNATMPSWGLISGYREGKEMAEAEARKYIDACGAAGCGVLILKPGVVSGTRYVGSVALPLWLAFEPARMLLRLFAPLCRIAERTLPSLLGGILGPAVRAEELASAAADAIEDESFSGVKVLGVEELVGYKSAVKAQ